MITVRRDAVRTQGRAPKGGGDQGDHEAVGSSSRPEAHAEVVKCDISATANTLKSQDTPNLLSPIGNIRAVTLKLYSRALSSPVEFVRVESLPRCSTVPAASFNEGFYKVALICVFEARLHRATS
jgi:hypothetical protein